MAMGSKYGAHRVLEPKGLLPQAVSYTHLDVYKRQVRNGEKED